jgi:hypothetical protein
VLVTTMVTVDLTTAKPAAMPGADGKYISLRGKEIRGRHADQ